MTCAVFASPAWTDQARLRVWAKQTLVDFVLLTEEMTDANVILARQLRCSGVTTAVVRVGGSERGLDRLAQARSRRDAVIVGVADVVLVFALVGELASWEPLRMVAPGKFTMVWDYGAAAGSGGSGGSGESAG